MDEEISFVNHAEEKKKERDSRFEDVLPPSNQKGKGNSWCDVPWLSPSRVQRREAEGERERPYLQSTSPFYLVILTL